jgi:hypothetical protein
MADPSPLKMFENWKSEATPAGYTLAVSLVGKGVLLSLFRECMVRGNAEGTAVPTVDRFYVSDLSLYFPVSVAEVGRVADVWCDAFDPGLRALLPELLDGLRAHEASTPPPASPQGPSGSDAAAN